MLCNEPKSPAGSWPSSPPDNAVLVEVRKKIRGRMGWKLEAYEESMKTKCDAREATRANLKIARVACSVKRR